MKWVSATLLVACCLLPPAAMASAHAACKSSKKSGHTTSLSCGPKARALHTSKARHKAKGATSASIASTASSAGAVSAVDAIAPGLPSDAPRTHGDSPCFAALGASQATRHLASRVPFLVDQAPGPEVLQNTGHPSKAEASELSSVAAGYGMCFEMAAPWRRATYAPEVQALLDDYWSHAQSILGSLQTGKRTFADAARALAENDKTYRAKVDGMVVGLQPPLAQ